MPESALIAAGYFDLTSWSAIEISGPDAADYLNRLSTRNFKTWNAHETRLGAFLTGKSGVVSLGFFQPFEKGFYFFIPPDTLGPTLEHLEKFHFAENLTFSDRSGDFALLALWKVSGHTEGVSFAWTDPWSSDLHWVCLPRTAKDAFKKKLAPLPELSLPDFERLQMSLGFARPGKDIDSSVLLLEAGLEKAVDRNKGCYPGQEVVERIFTYGQVNRKLFPVRVRGQWENASLPLKFVRDGKPACTLIAWLSDPRKTGQAVGLAFMNRSFWDSKETFEQEGVEISIL